MPIRPFEIMLGKIVPYVLVGFMQATLFVGAGILLFVVPIEERSLEAYESGWQKAIELGIFNSWTAKMREALGAPIDDDTANTIVKYLSATYAAQPKS